MEQFEQLLTCAICLDRYRNPKLLPCQHSFCMEPCMDGLVDYVRRQVKCPECRAEHRIPYQGVQAFPTNVTLQRFLELHIEITGELPDPTSGQTMERCGVCSEKSYCSLCVHCEKKCCPECKDAHMDILRREIARINSQVRRGLHRLQDALALVEKNTLGLQTNCASVAEEVDEIYRRLSKALKDRTEHLRNEVDRYLGSELRGLIQLKENLELEIANIQSNCDLAEAHINENVPWDDVELLDTKELFLRTVEFIRNFEYEAGDYGRRVRFVMAHDPNQLVVHVAGYGELNIKPETGSGGLLGSSSSLAVPGNSPGLMRSKSDHRLASQYRQQEEERLARNRYVPEYEYDAPEYEVSRNKSRYRSRFMRHRDGDDSDGDSRSTVRFTSTPQDSSAMRERVLDTEDAARGPLSGIFRLTDSPRVMKKLQECERAGKRKKEEPAQPVQPQPPKPQVQVRKTPTAVARQVSEDDEITRIKKQNKNTVPPPAETVEERQPVPHAPMHPPPRELPPEREPEEPVRRTTATRRTSAEAHTPSTRSASSDSSTGSESSTGSGIRNTGAPFTTEEMKQKYLARAPPTNTTTAVSSGPGVAPVPGKAAPSTPPTTRPFQSRFLGTGSRAAPPPPTQSSREESTVKKKEEEEDEDEETSSSSEETESETEEESETDVHPTPPTPAAVAPSSQERQRSESAMARTDIGPLLARSAEARRGSKEESPSTRYTPRGSPALSVTSPTATTTTTTTAPSGGATLTTPGGYTSRFVAHVDHDQRSRSEACSYSSNPPDHNRFRTFSDENDDESSTDSVEDNEIADYDLGKEDEFSKVDSQSSKKSDSDVITGTDESTVITSSSSSSVGRNERHRDTDGDDYVKDECFTDGHFGNDDKRDDRTLVIDVKETRTVDNESISRRFDNVCAPSDTIEASMPWMDSPKDEALLALGRDGRKAEENGAPSKQVQGQPEIRINGSADEGSSGEESESESDSEETEDDFEEDSKEIRKDEISENNNNVLKRNSNSPEKDNDNDNDTEKDENTLVNRQDEGKNANDTDGDDEVVLTGQLNIRFENSSSKDRYNDSARRWSRSSLIGEKSIEELFDENGWMVTDPDLLKSYPQSDETQPIENQEKTTETETKDVEIIPNERKRSSSLETIECTVENVSESVSRSFEILPRSKVYKQSSIGKDGWVISDESESESGRSFSPAKKPNSTNSESGRNPSNENEESLESIKESQDKTEGSNRSEEETPIEATADQEGSVMSDSAWSVDENGWVILRNVEKRTADQTAKAAESIVSPTGRKSTSTIRSSTELVPKTSIENGALVTNASQTKDERSERRDEQSRANVSISMQMVTTVLCMSILCYSVLTNLFL